MDLLSLVVLCSPLVDPATTLRVIDVESGGHPYAIHDNTEGRSYDGANSAQAVSIASALIRAGHRVDLGLMQINYEVWLRPTGFSLEKAFDACTNVRLGTTILSANYAKVLRRSVSGLDAANRAHGSTHTTYSAAAPRFDSWVAISNPMLPTLEALRKHRPTVVAERGHAVPRLEPLAQGPAAVPPEHVACGTRRRIEILRKDVIFPK